MHDFMRDLENIDSESLEIDIESVEDNIESVDYNKLQDIDDEEYGERLQVGLCAVCLINKVKCSISCGHTFCVRCLSKLSSCAICRKEITEIRPVYLHEVDLDTKRKRANKAPQTEETPKICATKTNALVEKVEDDW
jgi:hypothetical protein